MRIEFAHPQARSGRHPKIPARHRRSDARPQTAGGEVNDTLTTRRTRPAMRTTRKTYKWTFGLAAFALALTTMSGLNLGPTASADGGSDLGTSPFDFADAAYRAH